MLLLTIVQDIRKRNISVVAKYFFLIFLVSFKIYAQPSAVPGVQGVDAQLAINPSDLHTAKSSLNQKKLYIFSNTLPEICLRAENNFEKKLYCAQRYFFMNGKPINPWIIQDLTTWLSDHGDQVVAINLLDTQDSNRYFYDDFYFDFNANRFYIRTVKNDDIFSYEFEGITSNGTILIKTTNGSTNGTGVFEDLLFLRIREDVGFGKVSGNQLTLNKKRILIERIGSLPLGDRANVDISIKDNTVTIKTEEFPSGTKSEKTIVLSLKNIFVHDKIICS